MSPFIVRPILDFPIGNLSLKEHHALFAAEGLTLHPHAWLSQADLNALIDLDAPTLIDAAGNALAWTGSQPETANALKATESFLIVHPWDLLRANELFVGSLTESKNEGEIHPAAVIEGVVQLGLGSRILPGVYIKGNAVIGANCKIGPNCYIRGSTSIGDKCHIGQAVEIKNSLILSGTAIGHLSYVGDSVVGEKVNFGAGTITSNFRHDGKSHRTMVDGELIDTGRRKFGAIIGDGVHTGIHTSIYPGRKLAAGTSTRPGDIVQRDLTH